MKRGITVFLSTLLILSVVLVGLPIDTFAANTGTSSLTITEGGTVSRAQWIHELVGVMDLADLDERYPDLYFTDITEESDCYDDVMLAAKYGMLYIDAGGEFGPDDPATREFSVQTIAFCLGLHLDEKTYTFSDVESVTDADAAQIAVNKGWLELVDGKFLPTEPITSAEALTMLADADSFFAKQRNTETVAEATFADYVIQIPTDVDIIGGTDDVTLIGYEGTLSKGDTFVYYESGFPFVKTVDSVKLSRDELYIKTVAAPEDAIIDFQFAGSITPEITAVDPDEEEISLMTVDGEVVVLSAARAIQLADKLVYQRSISIDGIASGSLYATVSNLTLDYDVSWLRKEGYITLNGKFDLTSTIELNLLPDPALQSISLGYVSFGSFGGMGLSVDVSLNARITYAYWTNFSIGAGYDDGFYSIMRFPGKDSTLTAEGKASVLFKASANIDVVVASAGASFSIGPKVSAGIKLYGSGTPTRCAWIQSYLYAGGNVYAKFFGKSYSESIDIYNAKNSPVKTSEHIEDGVSVSSCTRGYTASDVTISGIRSSWFSPSNSYYYATGTTVVNNVPIWTTSENEDGTLTITGYQGNGAVLTIPETIDGKTVTAIGSNVFENNTRLRIVNMPDTITSIGDSAFSGCKNLQMVALSDGLISIGSSAFSECASLTSVNIPDAITEVKAGTFANCSALRAVTLPKSLTTMGAHAFYNCDALTAIEIPNDLQETTDAYIYAYAYGYVHGPFYACNGLKTVTFEEGMTRIPNGLFANCPGIEEIIIPNTVTTVGNIAFQNCANLKQVTLSNALTVIGSQAFAENVALESIVIPDSVLSIHAGAFANCTALQTVTLPKSLTTMGAHAFYNCDALTAIEIPNDLQETTDAYIYAYAYGYVHGPFYACNGLKTVTFEEGMTHIPNGLFANCPGIEEIVIPDTVTTIGSIAFQGCSNLKQVTLSNALTWIGSQAFAENSSLESIEIPDSVLSISAGAFANCTGLQTATLSKNLTTMGAHAFYNCDALAAIEIPNGLRETTDAYIYAYAYGYVYGPFYGCDGLKTVTFEEGMPLIPNDLFANCPGVEEIVIPNSVTVLSDRAFSACSNLERITLPNELSTLGYSVFDNCASLKEISIPDSVTSVGSKTFLNCSSLASAKLPAALQKITYSMFGNCFSLAEITLPETITVIQEQAFNNCDALTAIVLPDSVITVEKSSFYDCDALANITIGRNVTSIGDLAFYDCDALETIFIPDNVTSLGRAIFYFCDLLKEVDLGYGITTIPTQAFFECPALESIHLPYRVTTINSQAFANCTKLTEATILRNTATINTDAFSYPEILTISGVAGTYAETYANTIGATFEEINLPVTTVTLSDTTLEMAKGASHQLTATFDPRYFTDAVTWKSSDTNVVTVSDNGLLKAVGTGTATIKINAGSKGASCKITVMQPVTSIGLNRTSLTMNALDTYQLTATVYPDTALNKEVSWSSSDPEVATVDQTGFVTAITKGTATITATAKDGSSVTKSCTVTVTNSTYVAASVADLESLHNYEDGCSDYWVYTKAGAETLYVTFDERTNMEDGFDFLKLYDSDGTLIGTYTGTELADATIEVPGDTVRIQIVSDDSGNEWGFKVTSVTTESAEAIVPVEDAQLSQDGEAIVLTIHKDADNFTQVFVGIYHPTTGQMLGVGVMEYDSSTETLTMQLPDGLPGNFTLQIYCTDDDFAPLYEICGFTKDMLR